MKRSLHRREDEGDSGGGGGRVMTVWRKEEGNATRTRQHKRERDEASKAVEAVEAVTAPGDVAPSNRRRFIY